MRVRPPGSRLGTIVLLVGTPTTFAYATEGRGFLRQSVLSAGAADDAHHRLQAAPAVADAPLCSDTAERLPGQHVEVPLGFVHITKTGGTALKRQLNCPDVRCAKGHEMTAGQFQKQGMHAIATLREPLERFASAFAYSANGSDVHPQQDKQELARRFDTLSSFVDALRGRAGDEPSDAAWELLLHREHGRQFRAQVDWVADGDPARTHYVCYDELALTLNLEHKLQQLGSRCSTADVAVLNNSSNYGVDVKSLLTTEQTHWVRQYYRNDTMLYNAHCKVTRKQTEGAAAHRVGFWVITAEHDAPETERAVRAGSLAKEWVRFSVAPSAAAATYPKHGSSISTLKMPSLESFGFDASEGIHRSTNGDHVRQDPDVSKLVRLNHFLRAKVLAQLEDMCDAKAASQSLDYFIMSDDDTAWQMHELQAHLDSLSTSLSGGDARTGALYAGRSAQSCDRNASGNTSSRDLILISGGSGIIFSRGLLDQWCPKMGECRAVLDQDDAAENHAMRLVRKGQWKTSKRPTRGGGDEFVKACLSFSGFGREIQRCEAGYKMRDLPPWFSQWFLTANLNARDAVNFTAGETADDLELPATAAGAWAPLAAAGRAAPRVPAWGAPDQAAVSFHRVKPSVRAQGPLSRDPRCTPWNRIPARPPHEKLSGVDQDGLEDVTTDFPGLFRQVNLATRCEVSYVLVGSGPSTVLELHRSLRRAFPRQFASSSPDEPKAAADEAPVGQLTRLLRAGEAPSVVAKARKMGVPAASLTESVRAQYMDLFPHVDPRDFHLSADVSTGGYLYNEEVPRFMRTDLVGTRVLLVLREPAAQYARALLRAQSEAAAGAEAGAEAGAKAGRAAAGLRLLRDGAVNLHAAVDHVHELYEATRRCAADAGLAGVDGGSAACEGVPAEAVRGLQYPEALRRWLPLGADRLHIEFVEDLTGKATSADALGRVVNFLRLRSDVGPLAAEEGVADGQHALASSLDVDNDGAATDPSNMTALARLARPLFREAVANAHELLVQHGRPGVPSSWRCDHADADADADCDGEAQRAAAMGHDDKSLRALTASPPRLTNATSAVDYRWLRNLFYLRIQKTASTTFMQLCEHLCDSTRALLSTSAAAQSATASCEVDSGNGRLPFQDGAAYASPPSGCTLWDLHADHTLYQSIKSRWPQPLKAFTVLRAPLDRALSEFAYCHTRAHGASGIVNGGASSCFNQDQWDYEALPNGTRQRLLAITDVKEWAQTPGLPAHNRMTRMLAGYGQRRALTGGVIEQRLRWYERLSGLARNDLYNDDVVFTTQVSRASEARKAGGFAPTTQDDLALAKAHLVDLTAFGIVEELEGSLRLMSRAFGWPSDGAALFSFTLDNELRTNPHEGLESLPEDAREALRAANAHDFELYEFGKALLARRLAALDGPALAAEAPTER